MYSQAPLLALLSAGKIPGESGVPKHIETVMANVFLFPERVYKLYKNNNEFVNKNFVDLSNVTERFVFSRADFEWNRQLSKEIYIELQAMKIDNGEFRLVDTDADAEELLIITKRMPIGTSLFEHLQNDDLSEAECYNIGQQFAEREKNLVYHEGLPNESVSENMIGRHHDVIEWVKDVEMHVPESERDSYSIQLKTLIENLYRNDKKRVGVCIDIHSLNAFYLDQELYPFDCYSVKYDWRFGPPIINIFRLATDVFALVGEKEFRAVIRGYCEFLKIEMPSKEIENLFVMYSALIMVSYLYMLAKTDPGKQEAAEKYHNFLKRYSAEANFL